MRRKGGFHGWNGFGTALMWKQMLRRRRRLGWNENGEKLKDQEHQVVAVRETKASRSDELVVMIRLVSSVAIEKT